MNERTRHAQGLGPAEWVGSRGDKWATQLRGMEAMLAPIDAPLLQALQLEGARRIADVGCGGGGTTLAVAREAPLDSVVHGFDISPALIALARTRAESSPRSVRFEVRDLATTTPDQPYDRLLSRFGLMFFEDPPAAFRNLIRWLAPGGRFVFAVWGLPAENLWMAVRDVVAPALVLPAPDPTAPGPFRYAKVEKLSSLLEQSGFTQLAVQHFRGLLPVGGALPAAAAASFAIESLGALSEQLAGESEQTRARVHELLTESFAEHERDGVVMMDASVHIVTGSRD